MDKDNIVISVEHVSKDFKVYLDKGQSLKEKLLFWKRNRHEKREVLNDVSFKVKKGESVGLIGRNGCGKSTMLKMLTRIYYPNKGKITINGRVSSLIELGAGFHPDMSGRENIYINASVFGLNKKEIDARVDKIIEFSELENFIDNPVRTYSSGMYMRLAFSVAINVDADILLIDEILAVGDANFQNKCFNKLNELKAEGATIVLVTHSMQSILDFCDKCIWIEKGKIKGDGKTIPITDKYIKYMLDEAVLQSLNEMDRASVKIEAARRDLEKKRKLGLDSSQDHFGTGAAVFKDAYILNSDNKRVTTLKTGEAFSVVMKYDNKRKLKDLVFAIGFTNIDKKTAVYGTNTKIDKKKLVNKQQGEISFHSDYMPLQKGEYYLSIGLYDNGGMPLDVYKTFIKLTVLSDVNSTGYILINHTWKNK